ncbi:Hypothetical protein I595_318 [Croceitalea dokdonensis DOKDO 023]|uniref:HEXXH motif domain-containing protein n=1 Tax=Croceitalea dokdonensis DOKDO 023 TaxID=1300341 RepID=A0A0P7AYX8_9FLAO|nr:hypothetical protein [Croceitalea dokdonensis]KPM33415.1 Hypothetical protein I595_318 [Croceitalea dokdonensis DOKDO 023]
MDFFTQYHDHHLKLIDTLKTVLYQKDNSIFDKLDFYDDVIFSEPLLFACINNKYEEWIDILIFSLTKNKSETYTQNINNKLIYLPTIGYLKLKREYSKIIQIMYANNSIQLMGDDNELLEYELQPLIKNKDGIEFLQCNHPLLEPLFVNEQGKITEVIINEKLYLKHIEHFNNALEIISQVYPEYYDLVKLYIKKVVFYQGEANSFATIQAHGIAFFNVKDDYNEIFFLDNIVHQCAHVFFNALTLDKKDLFTLPYNSDLSLFTDEENDKGFVLYDRFHGLFTQTNINICLERCIQKEIFWKDKNYELLGRFTSNMNRFKSAIIKFDRPNKYKKQGLIFFNFFKSVYTKIYKSNFEVLNLYDVSNQPYVFDYKIFKKTNSL